MQELGFRDGRNRSNWPNDGSRNLAGDANEGHGVGTALGIAPTEGKGGDIDAELSKSAPDLADNSGLVPVSQIKDRSFKLCLQWDSFDLQQPRRTIVEHSAFGREAFTGSSLLGQRGNLERIGEAVLPPAGLLLDR